MAQEKTESSHLAGLIGVITDREAPVTQGFAADFAAATAADVTEHVTQDGDKTRHAIGTMKDQPIRLPFVAWICLGIAGLAGAIFLVCWMIGVVNFGNWCPNCGTKNQTTTTTTVQPKPLPARVATASHRNDVCWKNTRKDGVTGKLGSVHRKIVNTRATLAHGQILTIGGVSAHKCIYNSFAAPKPKAPAAKKPRRTHTTTTVYVVTQQKQQRVTRTGKNKYCAATNRYSAYCPSGEGSSSTGRPEGHGETPGNPGVNPGRGEGHGGTPANPDAVADGSGGVTPDAPAPDAPAPGRGEGHGDAPIG